VTAAARSLAVFPGGSLGEYDLPPELAVVLARGEGARVWDTEGRERVDFTKVRLAYGGAQERYGVEPDLAALGKALGGGYPLVDYRTAFAGDRRRARAFTLGLFRRGVFLNPMSTKLYLSLAHDEADIQRFLDAARAALVEDCRAVG
jgi:glutamate-1-semialdehyde aminotransferase